MSRARTHYPHPDPDARQGAQMGLCGIPGSALVELVADVTCKVCLQRLRALREVQVTERSRDTAGLPVLTPGTWASRDCACGVCALCLHMTDARRQAAIPPRHVRDMSMHRYRWGSVAEAAHSYVVLRIDGLDCGKSIGQAVEELARLGAMVDQSSRDPIRKAHLQAAEVGVFERVLAETFADFAGGWRRAMAVFLVATVGEPVREGKRHHRRTVVRDVSEQDVAAAAGLSLAEVRAVCRRARQALGVELALRDLVPPPREKSRAWTEFQTRLAAMDEEEDAA